MSGPTLQLNITAPGQKSVQLSVETIERLARALETLPKASQELAKLQKQLAGVQAPTGLKTGAADFKQMVTEIQNLSAQLNTSFASLEETIKKGYTRTAQARAEGEKQSQRAGRSHVKAAQEEAEDIARAQRLLDAQYMKSSQAARASRILYARALFAKDFDDDFVTSQVGPMATSLARGMTFQQTQELKQQARAAREAQQLKVQAQAASLETVAAFERISRAEAKFASQSLRRAAGSEAATQALLYRKGPESTAALAKLRDHYTQLAAGAEAAALQATAAFERLSRAEAKLASQALRKAAGSEAGTQALLYRKGPESRSTLNEMASYYRLREAGFTEDEAWRQRLNSSAQRNANAHTARAEKEAAALLSAQQRLDAAYRVASERQRANQVLLARAMMDQGMSRAQVTRRVGTLAFDAAAAQSFETARQNVDRLTATTPKIQFFRASLSDAHSAARGLASGFGAMYLIWGRVAPLLAGAALSQSFVQSIKVGAGVRQELETIRVLSLESQDAVNALERQLISLGERGPFGPQQVAEAMRILSLAGLSAAQVSAALKPSLDLAITGQTTIEKSAESLVAIGTAYGFQAEQFSGVADIIAKSAAVSMSSVDGMMQSFRQSSAVAQQYKVDLRDAATGLALLANVGIRNTAAGTALRQMYAELSGASGPTRKAMERLKVEVIDLEKGGMRPLLDIVRDLDQALGGLGPKAFVRAIQDISNERGGKALVAVLEAIRAKAKEAGTTAQNELERIRLLIEESAGFNALSAAQLSATPQMQMKAVATGFQTSLFEAFKAIEPTILVVSRRLQDLFKSSEFRSVVTGLASGMANLTALVIEHVDLLQYVVAGYAAWKGAAVGIALVTGVINAGSAALALYRARGLQAAAALTVMEATSKRAAAASLAFLGPIGAIAGAIGLIALTYSATTAQVSASEVDAAQIRQTVVAQSLDDEIERLKKVNEELRKKPDLLLAEQRAAAAVDAQKRRMAVEEQAAPIREKLAQVDRRMYEALQRDPRLAQGAELYVRSMPGAMDMATSGRNPRTPQEYKYIQSEEFKFFRDQLLREQYAQQLQGVMRPFWIAEDRNAAAQRELVRLQQENMAIARPGFRAYGTEEGWDQLGGGFREQLAQSRALQDLQKQHSDRQQTIDRAYQRERELLDQSYRGKLIAEAEFANQSELLAQREYQAKIGNLSRFVSESEALIKRLQSDPKTSSRADPALQQIELDKRRAQEDLAYEREKERIRAASSGNLSSLKLDEDLSKLQRKGDLEVERLGVENRRLAMDPRLAAAEEAAAQRAAEYNDLIAQQANLLQQVQARLNAAYSAQGEDAAGNPVAGFSEDPLVQRLNAQVEFLREQLATAKAAQEVESRRAGAVAFARTDSSMRPQWQKTLDSWKVESTLLKETQDEFMNSWLDRGRNMWMEFFEGGKINLKSFTKLMEQTLGDVIFKRFIAQPMMKLGDFAFDNFLRAPTTTAPGDTTTAMKELGYTAQNLTDVFKNVGSGLYDLLVKAAQALAAMMQTSGSGDGIIRSIGNWLASAVGGAGGSSYVEGGDVYVKASARGNAFTLAGAHAFARGGQFANTVVDTPTFFKFGMGGKDLGVMGERQPEAILPLERDASGMLGVRATGGGQAAPKVTVLIENHSGGPEPTVTESTAPNGDQMIKVMIGAATRDIGTGGPLRQSMQKHMNTSTRLRRY